jgi:L-iditol 2-dehydrogenase
MKAARVGADGRLVIEEMPVPEIGPGEALIRIAACGICSSDSLDWYRMKKVGHVLGHEPAGVVMRVGAGVVDIAEGDRVFAHHHVPCLVCRYCRRGRYVLCPTWRTTQLDPGGLAEFARVPAVNLSRDTLKLPASLPIEAGALVEPLATVLKAFARGRFEDGMSLLIIGLGVMGQLAVAVGRLLGASRIFAADRVVERLRYAERFGATHVIDVNRSATSEAVARETSGEGVDFVFVGPGSRAAMEEGLASAGPGATVLFFTMAAPGETISIEPYRLYFNEIDLIPSYSCGPEETRDALGLLEAGRIRSEDFITHRFALSEAQTALDKVREARDALKVLVLPG